MAYYQKKIGDKTRSSGLMKNKGIRQKFYAI